MLPFDQVLQYWYFQNEELWIFGIIGGLEKRLIISVRDSFFIAENSILAARADF